MSNIRQGSPGRTGHSGGSSIYQTPTRQFKPAAAAPRSRRLPVAALVLIDILCFGVCLVTFAYFHHVRPIETWTVFKRLQPTPFVVATPVPTPVPTPSPTPAATAADTAAPTATPYTHTGMWGEKFASHFTTGEIIETENSYQSANMSVTVEKVQRDGVTYYVADIFLADLQYFKTAFAGGEYGRGNADSTLNIANQNNAILAISGENYGGRSQGVVLRNGVLYRETPFEDVLVMYFDGSMKTFEKQDLDLASIKTNGAYQIWSFGPQLLADGQPMTQFNSEVNPKNPRAAIGYYEPGHYCFVLVDGRQDGYSVGMTLKELSQLFYDLGCDVAYNLDGGQTAVMTFRGEWANQPYHNGREISDIVYIGE